MGYDERSRTLLNWTFGVSSALHTVSEFEVRVNPQRELQVRHALVLLAIQGKIELISDLQKAGTLRFKIFSARYRIRIFSHVSGSGLIIGEELGIKRLFDRWAEPLKKITVNDARHIVYNTLQKTLLSDPALR